MYGSQRGNRQQLKKFIIRIEEKRAELEQKRNDLDVMLNDLQAVEEKCHLALAHYGKDV